MKIFPILRIRMSLQHTVGWVMSSEYVKAIRDGEMVQSASYVLLT